ncbi:MAG TPA: hypothetical protein VJ144_10020, partial [Candidatus Polarisedimenticolia bacterium]|nr:hypothetical protein [Candidatus Polarisedimenticolia bacterium]
MERPHIFSYLLAAGFLVILARRRSTGRAAPLWPLIPLQIAWTNLHGSFLMGPLLAGLAAAAEAIEGLLLGLAPATASRDRNPAAPREAARPHLREAGTLAVITALLTVSCMANPYGARLLLFPFQLLGSSFMRENYEWLPPFGSDFSSTYMMRYYVVWSVLGLGVLAAALVRVVRRGLRPPAGAFPPGGLFPLLVFAALLSLSLRMQRNVTDFALGTLPGVAATASWLLPCGPPRAARRPWLPATALLLAALAAWFGWHGYPYRAGSRRPLGFGLGRNIPVAAADYVEENGLRGNAFNTYAAGAYLVYRFYPWVRVGMDSRNDVYGPELYHRYLRALAEPDVLARMLETLDASFVFLEWSAVPSGRILEDLGRMGWRLVYFDDSIAILLRAGGPWSALAARDGYAVLDPQRYVRTMPKIDDPDRAFQEAA